MAKAERFPCPCDFSMTATGWCDDPMKHVILHKNDHHEDVQMTPEQLNSMIRKVDVGIRDSQAVWLKKRAGRYIIGPRPSIPF